MNPGLSPIFIPYNASPTNVPPAGGAGNWQLTYHPDENPVPMANRPL